MRRVRTVEAAALGASASLLCTIVAGAVPRAEADEPHVVLVWNAPPACPSEATVRGSLAFLLAGSSAAVDARADVHRAGDAGERWEVVLLMNGGERRLSADSCHALADATALIVAMAVDPARVAANRTARDGGVANATSPTEAPDLADASLDAGPEADAAATSLPAASAADAGPTDAFPVGPYPALSSPPSVPPSSPPPPSSPSRFSAFASAALDVGALPTPSFGPSLGFSWTPGGIPTLRLDLTGSYFPSSSTSIPAPAVLPGAAPSAGSATFSLLAGALRACYLAHPGPFELGPCGGAEVGLLQGSSQGISTTSRGASPLFAFDAGLFAAWRFAAAWVFFARGDLLLETNRQTFEVNASQANAAPVNTPGLLTGRAALGLELRF